MGDFDVIEHIMTKCGSMLQKWYQLIKIQSMTDNLSPGGQI